MKLADLSINRPVMTTMLVMSFVVLGLFSLTRIGIDIFPEIDFPFVITTIVYPGAGPEEMESLVAEPVEEEISSIGGIKNVTSVSQEGLTIIISEFDLGMNVDLVAIDVKDKIDLIRNKLPEDIFDPVIQKFDFAALPIIDLAVSSPRALEETYKLTEEVVKQRLGRVRGLANIQLTGGREREIQVNLSRRKLREYELTPIVVIGCIASQNLNIPAGLVNEGRHEISVRMTGEFSDLDQLRSMEIPLEDGLRVRLDEVAWVEDSFKEQRDRAFFNGQPSVGVGLIKRADANTVEVARDVFKELDRIREEVPEDFHIDIARDRSKFIQDSVDDIFGNIIVGVLLTAVVLFLFLHNLSSTIIAAISMPTSIIATFILVDFAGFTLNFMSLTGLAVSVGILVANSIVVLENIERYKARGLSSPEAASTGTREIAIAVIASTMTNVVVFTPMAFMSGIVGRFFIQFGLTVAFATMFSLLVCFTLTPMMASGQVRKWVYIIMGGFTFMVIFWRLGLDQALMFLLVCVFIALAGTFGLLEKLFKVWDRLYNELKEDYRKSLEWTLRHKTVFLLGVSTLLVGSILLLTQGFIGSEFFPRTDQSTFSVSIEMPVASSLEETERTVSEVAKRVMSQLYVKSVYAAVGKSEEGGLGTGQGLNYGVIIGQMVDKEHRPISTAQFIKQLRTEVIDLPDARISLKETSPFGGGGEADMQVEITGYETDRLNAYADSIKSFMEQMSGLINIRSSWQLGKPEMRIIPKRSQLADRELTSADVGMMLRTLVEGDVASKYREGGEEYDIRVRLDKADLRRAEDIASINMKAGEDHTLLSELTTLEYTEGPTSISHKNKSRLVMVTSDIASGTMGQKVSVLREMVGAMEMPPGYGIHFGGETEHMEETFGELFKALIMAIILTYMLLAAVMESMKHPFIIMMTFPLGVIGVLVSLFLTNNSISIFSLMAMVMLVGIVVNNGILLIDYIGRLRREGMALNQAILEACPVRLRPIIMTNLATALGVLPLALGLGSGGEFRSPMGIVTIGGLITSTIFTLYVIPILYKVFEGKQVVKS